MLRLQFYKLFGTCCALKKGHGFKLKEIDVDVDFHH